MNQRGVVLPITLIVLVVCATLVTGLLALGVSEPQISANLLHASQATALAEAGAERALAHFLDPANKGTVDGACPATPCAGGATLWQDAALGGHGTYTVTWRPIAFATVLVESRGQTAGASPAAERTVRMIITSQFDARHAIVADDIEIGGNGRVDGNLGSVHGNDDVDLDGSAWVQVTATSAAEAESSCTNCADADHVGNAAASGPGRPTQPITTMTPQSLLPKADFVFGDGVTSVPLGVVPRDQIYLRSANRFVSPDPAAANYDARFDGWSMHEDGEWSFSGSGTPPSGTFYASRELRIRSSPGTDTPWRATLVAGGESHVGEVEIEGSPVIHPYLGDMLIVAGTLDLQGTPTLKGVLMSTAPDGWGDEVNIRGNVSLTGNIIARGSVDVSGNADITYDVQNRVPTVGPLRIVSWSAVPR